MFRALRSATGGAFEKAPPGPENFCFIRHGRSKAPRQASFQKSRYFNNPLLLIASIARRISGSSWTSAMRRYPRPEGPKALPGVMSTPVLASSSWANAWSSVRPPGSLAQTNIVARDRSTGQPIAVRPSQRMSRRSW